MYVTKTGSFVATSIFVLVINDNQHLPKMLNLDSPHAMVSITSRFLMRLVFLELF